MASKAKNIPQQCTFLEGGKEVQWSERHGLTLGGAKLLKTSFPRFKTSFTQNWPLLSLQNNESLLTNITYA